MALFARRLRLLASLRKGTAQRVEVQRRVGESIAAKKVPEVLTGVVTSLAVRAAPA
jgi:hypothetical protein